MFEEIEGEEECGTMGAHGSKEKLNRSNSEKYPSKLPVPSDKKYKEAVNRERFGSFAGRGETSRDPAKLINTHRQPTTMCCYESAKTFYR